jgi:hypothetical protein
MARQPQPPFRWDAKAFAALPVKAIKVLDTDRGLKLELYGSAHGGDTFLTSIDVPFTPTAQHADCISIEDHNAEISRRIEAAVGDATARTRADLDAAQRKIAQLETDLANAQKSSHAHRADANAASAKLTQENEALKRQAGAANKLIEFNRDLDRLDVLIKLRPPLGHQLRVLLATYAAGNFPGYMTRQEYDAALAESEATHRRSAADKFTTATTRFRTAFEIASKRLSDAALKDPKFDVSHALEQIDTALAMISAVE